MQEEARARHAGGAHVMQEAHGMRDEQCTSAGENEVNASTQQTYYSGQVLARLLERVTPMQSTHTQLENFNTYRAAIKRYTLFTRPTRKYTRVLFYRYRN